MRTSNYHSMVLNQVLILVTIVGMGQGSTANAQHLSNGLNQLVVIKPGSHQRGLPAVNLEEHMDGQLHVDIPPTLHVHRYYFDGQRQYQGPTIQGGPTTVVANHPVFGKQMYIQVTLPAGTPVIRYSKHCITYAFPDRRVCIHFSAKHCDQAKISYHRGQGIARRAKQIGHGIFAKTSEIIRNSPTAQSVGDVTAQSKDLLVGGKQAIDDGAAILVDGTSSVIKMIPGVVPISSMSGQGSQKGYESQIRQYARQKERSDLDFIRTNR